MAKSKKCKVCWAEFVPVRPLQLVCSTRCSLDLVAQKKAKKAERDQREARKKIKTKRQWLAEVQKEFNAFIRARDFNRPCISCGRENDGKHQRHAGHFRTVKAAPELRFHPDNCHIQCSACNNHLSGNLINYRINLLHKIGHERVEWLEGYHHPVRWEIPELEAAKKEFRRLTKELEKYRNVQ